jgi:hypothetical protein
MLINGITGSGGVSPASSKPAAVAAPDPAPLATPTQPVTGVTSQPLSAAMMAVLLAQQPTLCGSYNA